MEEILSIFLVDLSSGSELLRWGGLVFLFAAVYIETGLLLGLIVPGGETLLFSAGLLIAAGFFQLSIYLLIPLLIITAIAGDITGYLIGRKSGKAIYNWNENFFYKKKYLERSQKYYNKHGLWILIFGRFLPVIRTFNPLISGIIKLSFIKFLGLTAVGVVLYISSLVLAGYILGKQFPNLKNYLEYIFLAVAILILAPVIKQLIQDNFSKKKDQQK